METTNNRKKLYRIPVTWQMEGYHEVEAWNEEKAFHNAYDLPLPTNGQPIEGSEESYEDNVYEIPRPEQVSSSGMRETTERTVKVLFDFPTKENTKE